MITVLDRKMSDLLNRLTEESRNLPEVIAPVPRKTGYVGAVINNHPYKFIVRVDNPGWYILKPTSSVSAKVSRPAEPSEIRKCLQSVRNLKSISVRRLTKTSWLIFPYNISDAKSRGFRIEPQECHLIDRNLEPFMTINTKLWGNLVIFDSAGIEPPPTGYIQHLQKEYTNPPRILGVSPEFKMVYNILLGEVEQAKRQTVEGRIKGAVEYLGAELVGFTESGTGYNVEWKDGRQTYRSRVTGNLRLESAGICLDGLEHEQTLTSTVAVMRKFEGDDDYDD